MEQHAIPQQISSYEFKLVGEMTLKQFLKAASGIVAAVLINGTGLAGLFKWPLMIICAGTGLMFAFVPFEDRPLEVWIKAFIKSIYSPTIYTYKKKADNSWLTLKGKANIEVEQKAEDVVEETRDDVKTKKDKKRPEGYLQTISLGVKNKKAKEIIGRDEKKPTEQVNDQKIIQPEVKKEEMNTQGESWKNQKVDLNLQKEKLGATGQAVFGTIPMPDRPEVANLIVGMATDREGKIVDGVIVEIQDEHGSSSRVLKTNSLGQFKISTPLSNGRYLIIAEKEGYNFDRVNVDLTGKIVEPIRIIALN